MSTKGFEEILKSAIKNIVLSEIEDFRSCLPAKVVSYKDGFISAKIVVGKKMAGGQEIDLPTIENVKVLYQGNSKVSIAFEPEVGDSAVLFFSDIDISGWVHNSIEGTPESIRRFNINDCYAIIADTRKGAPKLASDEVLNITAGDSTILAKKNGSVFINDNLEVKI